MKNIPYILLGSFTAVLLAIAACNAPRTVSETGGPSMKLAASRDSILVNESVKVFIQSQNTLGQHPKVSWDTSLGTITPDKEGMLDFRSDKQTATFTSDRPGIATVTARVTLDNGQTLSDSTNITVNNAR